MGYIGMCRCEEYGFQAVYSGKGYINQRVWVQNRVTFSRKLVNWLKILFQSRETWNCHSKIQKNQIGFVLARLCQSPQQFLENSYSRMGRGRGFGEFSLVQGSKIHVNQLWYRLRVPGFQRHIPTQKFLKYPPPVYELPVYASFLCCMSFANHPFWNVFSFLFFFFGGEGGGIFSISWRIKEPFLLYF